MKLVVITYRFEYADRIERILDRHAVTDYVRHALIEGSDKDGKHYGSQVFPGNMSQVQAQVEDDDVDGLLDDLKTFKEKKPSHAHLTAAVLEVGRSI